MQRTSEGETVYFVHKGCPRRGLSPIEEPDEQIAAVYFPKDDLYLKSLIALPVVVL